MYLYCLPTIKYIHVDIILPVISRYNLVIQVQCTSCIGNTCRYTCRSVTMKSNMDIISELIRTLETLKLVKSD